MLSPQNFHLTGSLHYSELFWAFIAIGTIGEQKRLLYSFDIRGNMVAAT
jgi:hypothetical protein